MDIQDYLNLIRRWLWLIIIGAVLGGLVAFVVSRLQTPYYRATSILLISEGGAGVTDLDINALRASEVLALSYVERLSNYDVLAEAIGNLGASLDPAELRENISIRLVGQTHLVSLSVEDPNPRIAADLANEIPLVFAERSLEQQQARFEDTKDSLIEELAILDQEIQKASEELSLLTSRDDSQTRIDELNGQLLQLRETHARLLQSYEDVRIAEAGSLSTIIIDEHARLPEVPVRPRVLTTIVLGAFVGGLVAAGIAFLIERLNDTVMNARQVFEDTGLPTLGTITIIKGDRPEGKLITHDRPRDPISEAFRVVRTNLDFAAIDDDHTSLLVTSTSPMEGKSTICANLAIVMAQADRRVILLDADLRRPVQHQLFGLSNNRGLTTTILEKGDPAHTYLQQTQIPGVTVLTSGALPHFPAEILDSRRMDQVLAELTQRCDFLIVDSPPALPVADAAIMAPKVGGCLLVVQAGVTKRDDLVETVANLQVTDTRLYGVVLNQLKQPSRAYYYYQQPHPQGAQQKSLPSWLGRLAQLGPSRK